jgi:hypothetical protein
MTLCLLARRGWTDIRRSAVFYHCHHWIGILCPLISVNISGYTFDMP